MSAAAVSPEVLASIPVFAQVEEDLLGYLAEHARDARLAAGDYLFREGDTVSQFFVLIEGEILIFRSIDGDEIVAGRQEPKAAFGEIPILSAAPAVVSMRACVPSRLLCFDEPVFRELMRRSEAFEREILQTMMRRTQGLERGLRQREKMASLGTLAAGLAHEINNPAAAVARAVSSLRDVLTGLSAAAAELARATGDIDPFPELARLASEAEPAAADEDPLERSEREEAVTAWLEERGVDEAWKLGPVLAERGIAASSLDEVARALPEAALAPALAWLSAQLDAESLLDRGERASGRISELVGAVKRWSHMDRGSVQTLDVHDGIEDSLSILEHRLGDIRVERDYDRDLPAIEAYGSELNQVWTNLLANAIEALGGRGTIAIRTRREGDAAVVDIGDDGPGIPAEIQSRIFEPFFTTKGVGEGSGLGLEIAYRSVYYRHGGQIGVRSAPGETVFTVRIPLVARS